MQVVNAVIWISACVIFVFVFMLFFFLLIQQGADTDLSGVTHEPRKFQKERDKKERIKVEP